MWHVLDKSQTNPINGVWLLLARALLHRYPGGPMHCSLRHVWSDVSVSSYAVYPSYWRQSKFDCRHSSTATTWCRWHSPPTACLQQHSDGCDEPRFRDPLLPFVPRLEVIPCVVLQPDILCCVHCVLCAIAVGVTSCSSVYILHGGSCRRSSGAPSDMWCCICYCICICDCSWRVFCLPVVARFVSPIQRILQRKRQLQEISYLRWEYRRRFRWLLTRVTLRSYILYWKCGSYVTSIVYNRRSCKI